MDAILIKGMLLGAIAVASAVAGLFFLKFWKATGDRLFTFFALAFFLQSCSRIFMGLSASSDDDPVIYLIRLTAYGLIIAGIVDKNVRKSPA